MTEMERQSKTALILSGVSGCVIDGKHYFIKNFDNYDVFMSSQIYRDTYRNAEISGSFTDDEILIQLKKWGLWNIYDEDLLKTIPKQIEDLKVQLFESFYKFKKRDNLRKNLLNKKQLFESLIKRRNEFRDVTCDGIAELTMRKYLIGLSTYDELGNKLFNHRNVFECEDSFLRKLVASYYRDMPTEEDIRDIIQNEPWRSYWSASKVEGKLFGEPASKLNEIQRSTILWSRIYDSVAENPDCPPDEVFEDNDVMDGWLIFQSRKRIEERKKQFGEKHIEKSRGADEVFVMVEETKDIQKDIERINDMMTPEAKLVKRQRLKQINEQGTVKEQHMIDSQMKIREKSMQKMREQIANGKKRR